MKTNKLDLQYFAELNTNKTTDPGMSVEMKTFYDRALIKSAKPNLVHAQFGQKRPIPKNGGKEIEFRKYSSLPKALKPLDEGITPGGRKLNATAIKAEIKQYGDYIALSDQLILTAIDNNIIEATELSGDQSGRTLDTVVREVINGGTNVAFANKKTLRHKLTAEDKFTVTDANNAARILKLGNTPKIDNYLVAIINPNITFDIVTSDKFIDINKYSDATKLFMGEIGSIGGVRFVESTEAKVFQGAPLTAATTNLTVKTSLSADNVTVTITEAITAPEALALANRPITMNGNKYLIASATAGAAGAATITSKLPIKKEDATVGITIYPGEGGAEGVSVYSTLIMGKNAYGVTEVEGGGLETIVKPLGSGGTSDPLNQRSTVGWKAMLTSVILSDEFLVRYETGGTYSFQHAN